MKREGSCLRTVVIIAASVCSVACGEQRIIPVDKVWSGHPVGFCLLTHGDHQYVSYYDAQRRMTVASRRLSEDHWEYVHLPSTLGWDSHNYVTMTIDDTGRIHLAGNMHCAPLVYFRTQKPYDIKTFTQIPSMVGRDETHVTYPQFLRGADNALLFGYRDGGSGKGNQIYNVYDPSKQSWRRLMDAPLIDGEGEMSAYLDGFHRDRQGMFHLTWCWRETSDAATNRDVCYARSRDLVHWERSDGRAYKLPITHSTAEIVDPVPPHAGLTNGNVGLGFDLQDRPVISYLKYDANGFTQAYSARLKDGRWRIRQVSNWNYRWDFGGSGSIPFEVRIRTIHADANGVLTQAYTHAEYGSGTWVLDPETLKPKAGTGREPARKKAAAFRAPGRSGAKPQPAHIVPEPILQDHRAGDSGASPGTGVSYSLHWQTLGLNRDHPREGPVPPPSNLELIETRR